MFVRLRRQSVRSPDRSHDQQAASRSALDAEKRPIDRRSLAKRYPSSTPLTRAARRQARAYAKRSAREPRRVKRSTRAQSRRHEGLRFLLFWLFATIGDAASARSDVQSARTRSLYETLIRSSDETRTGHGSFLDLARRHTSASLSGEVGFGQRLGSDPRCDTHAPLRWVPAKSTRCYRLRISSPSSRNFRRGSHRPLIRWVCSFLATRGSSFWHDASASSRSSW